MLKQPELRLSQEQTAAIAMCSDLAIRIAAVTGSAGTGKTVVLGKSYSELCDSHKVVLCAPTGRAAKRIQELTGIPAVTVHRLLEFPRPEDEGDPTEPGRNREKPIEQRIVFCDESSMLGPTLYQQLLNALPPNGLIRFFGDNQQLPPIEQGDAPFEKLLATDNSITLTYNYRSNDEIVSNAQRILKGSIPLRNSRFEIIYVNDPLKALRDFVTDDFTNSNYQVIVPTRNGNFGTKRINPTMQAKFNGKGPVLLLDRYEEKDAQLSLRAGDKFLWTKNDYQLELSNGETGRVAYIDPEDGVVGLVTADNREIAIPPFMKEYSRWHGHMIQYDPRKAIDLGYAVTTHKAQGSEYETVIYCISPAHAWMLNRRNFYTAITRARKNVIVIANTRAMQYAVKAYRRK